MRSRIGRKPCMPLDRIEEPVNGGGLAHEGNAPPGHRSSPWPCCSPGSQPAPVRGPDPGSLRRRPPGRLPRRPAVPVARRPSSPQSTAGSRTLTSLPPSSVSPAIERFVRQSGRRPGAADSARSRRSAAGSRRSAVAASLDAAAARPDGRSPDATDQPPGSVVAAPADAAGTPHGSGEAGC